MKPLYTVLWEPSHVNLSKLATFYSRVTTHGIACPKELLSLVGSSGSVRLYNMLLQSTQIFMLVQTSRLLKIAQTRIGAGMETLWSLLCA